MDRLRPTASIGIARSPWERTRGSQARAQRMPTEPRRERARRISSRRSDGTGPVDPRVRHPARRPRRSRTVRAAPPIGIALVHRHSLNAGQNARPGLEPLVAMALGSHRTEAGRPGARTDGGAASHRRRTGSMRPPATDPGGGTCSRIEENDAWSSDLRLSTPLAMRGVLRPGRLTIGPGASASRAASRGPRTPAAPAARRPPRAASLVARRAEPRAPTRRASGAPRDPALAALAPGPMVSLQAVGLSWRSTPLMAGGVEGRRSRDRREEAAMDDGGGRADNACADERS